MLHAYKLEERNADGLVPLRSKWVSITEEKERKKIPKKTQKGKHEESNAARTHTSKSTEYNTEAKKDQMGSRQVLQVMQRNWDPELCRNHTGPH